MIAIPSGLCILALFVSFVLLFGAATRRPRQWLQESVATEPRGDHIEAFRKLVRQAEIAAHQRAARAFPSVTQSPE